MALHEAVDEVEPDRLPGPGQRFDADAVVQVEVRVAGDADGVAHADQLKTLAAEVFQPLVDAALAVRL